MFFILDAIHEDLNRVLDKPFTEAVEANDRSDLQVGKESWEVFLKRNQSVMVDLLYGQFKSTIQCSECKSISKSFESFSICSVPIPSQKEIEVFFIYDSFKIKPNRMLIKYPDANHTLNDLRNELAKLFDKPKNTIKLAIGDFNSVRAQHDLDISTHEIGQSLGKSYLFACELSPAEMLTPPERRVYLGLQTSKADLVNEPGETMGVVKMLSFDKNITNKQVHLQIFSKYRFMFDEFWPYRSNEPYSTWSLEEACDEAFMRFPKQIYEVVPTIGVGEKRETKPLEYNDDRFFDTFREVEHPEKELLLQIKWRYIPTFVDLGFFKNFVRIDAYKNAVNKNLIEERQHVDIRNCLTSFAEPEQLDENNTWYCKKCAKHQNAIKKLELYKLPQIFLIHLKRFKTGDNTRWNRNESKIKDLITFPIENFDLSSYVINPNLPADYFNKESNGP